MRSSLVVPLLLALAGCGNLQVVESGAVDPGLQPLPGGLFMSFDRLGDATIGLKRVELPRGREVVRFGLTVVDVAPLARLVPSHVPPHRVVVSAVERASPFALVGLRPFDVVLAVDGAPVTTLQDLLQRLSAAEPGQRVRLTVKRPDGVETEVAAEAADRVLQQGAFKLPLLVERQSSGTGHAMGLGPLDLLFYYRSAIEHGAVPPARPAEPTEENPFPPTAAIQPTASRSRFARRFEWGSLLNMLFWESWTDLQTGEELGRFRLFWFLSFGDEVPEPGPWTRTP